MHKALACNLFPKSFRWTCQKRLGDLNYDLSLASIYRDFFGGPNILKLFALLFSLAGISRSVTMSAVYIISVTGLSVAEALQAIRSSRTIANPNFGFQKQLHDFEVNGGAQKVSIKSPGAKDVFCRLHVYMRSLMTLDLFICFNEHR